MAGTIVVGVDGSSPSIAALRWAADEAVLREANVIALHAWTFVPPGPIAEPGMIPLSGGDLTGTLDAERSAAESELSSAMAAAFPGGTPNDVEARLVEDDAGAALVGESESADLVVVGSSGRGGLASALLGSVSRHVAQRARCPVVVVKESS
jgi:nucleotide-binding universal stress UspA family protein